MSEMGTIDDDINGQKPEGRPLIDPCLIMEDIIEKLQLLDYKASFCPTRKLKPISRTFFALQMDNEIGGDQKFKYLVEICYWLMSLGYEDMWR